MHLNSKNESKFIGVCSRNNLAKIKNGAYVINLDDYKPIGTSLDVIYVTNDVTTYLDSFGVHHIPKEI